MCQILLMGPKLWSWKTLVFWEREPIQTRSPTTLSLLVALCRFEYEKNLKVEVSCFHSIVDPLAHEANLSQIWIN